MDLYLKNKETNKMKQNSSFCVGMDCRGKSVSRDVTKEVIKVVLEKDDSGCPREFKSLP